ncbi:MAG: hypothetical protein ACOX0K_04165 [Oscillospiraceae bacterium]
MSYEFDKRFDCCDKDEWRDCDKEHKDCEYLGKKVTECKYFRVCECKFHEPREEERALLPMLPEMPALRKVPQLAVFCLLHAV